MLRIVTNSRRFSEKAYVCRVLFEEYLGMPYQLETDSEASYSSIFTPSGAWVRMPDTFTSEQDILPGILTENAWLPHPFWENNRLPVICGQNTFAAESNGFHCGIDLLGACFFMLSRWEEHFSNIRDKHGRFPASASLAYRQGFLDRAVVHEYLDFLWEMLQRLGYRAERKKHQYKLVLTHDVDHPLLWWRPIERMRTLASALLKPNRRRSLPFWLKNWQNDPFDSFDWMMDRAEEAGLRAQFNFMGKRKRSSDAYYPLDHPFIRNLIQNIEKRGHHIGFHPSYESFDRPELFGKELESLQKLLTRPIQGGRQHYLRFAAPDTWRIWASHGLKYDSSVGYPEVTGFRCGACLPFPVYDVYHRTILPLYEQPLLFMEVTPAIYQGKTPESAREEMRRLRAQVRAHNGEFVVLWHNSSLNTFFWHPWKHLFTQLLSDT